MSTRKLLDGNGCCCVATDGITHDAALEEAVARAVAESYSGIPASDRLGILIDEAYTHVRQALHALQAVDIGTASRCATHALVKLGQALMTWGEIRADGGTAPEGAERTVEKLVSLLTSLEENANPDQGNALGNPTIVLLGDGSGWLADNDEVPENVVCEFHDLDKMWQKLTAYAEGKESDGTPA